MRVLYICTGNSFRSPTAEALTRKYHPGFEVESAGTHAAGFVAGNAKEFLKQEGALGYVKEKPDQLSQRAIDEADVIICMENNHYEFLKENFDVKGKDVRTWEIKDPITPDIEPIEAYKAIQENVKKLIP